MSEVEHVDVLIAGAGLSGIGAARHLQARCPWASFAILEGRDAIGGTWDLFRYPGIRSDSDMHTLGYSFRPWTGEKSIADGPDILQYIKDTAAETGVDRKVRFGHRIVSADWSTTDARWHVVAHRADTDDDVELTCSFFWGCTGYYRYDHGYVPDFEGMDDFGGQIVHPQHWPEDLDYLGKRVVVIGSGATAVTLVPSMAPTAAHVTMLQRSPTYMGSVPTRNPVAKLVRRLLPAPRGLGAAVVQRPGHPGPLPGEQAPAPAGEAGDAQGPRARPAEGLRHRHPLHAPLRPLGPARVRGGRRRPVPPDPQRQGRHRHRHHRSLHRDRHPPPLGRGARGRRHRCRPPGSSCCSWAASRWRSTARR
ncbi:MAG: NAD(P)/FAD-dependent oxidoreductase [Acidimicrobiales bacterium]